MRRRSHATTPGGTATPHTDRGSAAPPGRRPEEDARGAEERESPVGIGRLAPRNWRVAPRLHAILLIPVVVALVLAGLRVHTHYDTWRDAERAENVAELVRASTAYANALLDERDLTAGPLLAGDQDDPVVERSRAHTDRARAEFESRLASAPSDDRLARREAEVAETAAGLDELRSVAWRDGTSGAAETELGYVAVQHPVMSFANELGLGSDDLASYGRSVYAISLGQAAASLQRALGTHILLGEQSVEERARLQTTLSSYRHLERIARNEFVSAARPEDATRLDRAMAADGDGQDDPVDTMAAVLADPGTDSAGFAEAGVTPGAWFDAVTVRFDAYRDVERELVEDAVHEARAVAADARTDMITNSALVIAALLAAFVVAGLMARGMSRSMTRLRDAALDVAEHRLPEVVAQLSQADPGRVDTRVTPIRVAGGDEIGEVSRAFDQVHREAVRLASEQALLRGNVNAVFTNLAGRNQGLVERQLELIGGLEGNEADPEQLEHLFRLDHLATRMRRNGDNLLVLAGREPDRSWSRPVPLVDVVRAAASEVEHYDRIDIVGVPPGEIHGAVVTDLVHLLAELLENATSFSSPLTRVRVTATRLPDGRVMVEIHDRGVGLAAEDFALINHRLAEPPAADLDVSRRMGLFVVGRLALGHGIRVQLRPSGEQVGTTCLVMLPESITQGGHGAGQEDRLDGTPERFTVSRVVADRPVPDADAPRRTAADLGFDDSRYGDAPAGDHVGRSLRRGERRIAVDPVGGRPAAADDTAPGEYPDQPGAVPQPGPSRAVPADPAPWPQGHGAPHGAPHHPGGTAATGAPQGTYSGQEYGTDTPGTQPPHTPAMRRDTAVRPWRGNPAIDVNTTPDRRPEGEDAYPATPPGAAHRVGFHGAELVPEGQNPTTGAGLPRREPRRLPDGEAQWQGMQGPVETPDQAPHDRQWGRGPRREAQPVDTTDSGLPRRVPKANLVEHARSEPPAGGRQVSRAPEDVRGRLTDLHRGVRQGRGAGRDRAENDHEGFGPVNDQER
ncbi:sensor histidine kinase [Streptomyces lonarensis]|uniref:histidine kinase n=1 Tax=Streptomyces lonarensis TaxID=700599 RepID=A0A7X6D5H0_9ACTN|nr:nitrate- and nitrite sensing domain-containing protein [Streptomyces lonarensis]NJQ08537.1 HAMP domain-containing protein [Streptomyces lonarensis]